MEEIETEQEKTRRLKRGKVQEFEERIKAIEKRQEKLLSEFEEFRRKYG
jgi:hypothetical protein